MIFLENPLPADDSHETSFLICNFWKRHKIWIGHLLQIMGGALWVKNFIQSISISSEFRPWHKHKQKYHQELYKTVGAFALRGTTYIDNEKIFLAYWKRKMLEKR